jgi:argininosuccinate lyase
VVSDLTARFSRLVLGQEINISTKQLSQILDPIHFVNVRRVLGGPAPQTVKRSITRYRKRNWDRQRWIRQTSLQLSSYAETLTLNN